MKGNFLAFGIELRFDREFSGLDNDNLVLGLVSGKLGYVLDLCDCCSVSMERFTTKGSTEGLTA